eukprot:scaffold79166_cov18-Tisochrysis_lutea.AAC.1
MVEQEQVRWALFLCVGFLSLHGVCIFSTALVRSRYMGNSLYARRRQPDIIGGAGAGAWGVQERQNLAHLEVRHAKVSMRIAAQPSQIAHIYNWIAQDEVDIRSTEPFMLVRSGALCVLLLVHALLLLLFDGCVEDLGLGSKTRISVRPLNKRRRYSGFWWGGCCTGQESKKEKLPLDKRTRTSETRDRPPLQHLCF